MELDEEFGGESSTRPYRAEAMLVDGDEAEEEEEAEEEVVGTPSVQRNRRRDRLRRKELQVAAGEDADDQDGMLAMETLFPFSNPMSVEDWAEYRHLVASDKGYESGFLKSISMKNFMCHENLRIDFGPGINFIIGQNGSGKSAIVTALQVCCGLAANATQRSASAGDFILEGASEAQVAITFDNTGNFSYKPEVYGDSITLTRTIRRTSSKYTLKGADQRQAVEVKKNVVERLLLFWNIQVSNPVAVLTQENAKTLLKSSDPKKLYETFSKAAMLDSLARELNSGRVFRHQARENKKHLNEKFNALRAELKEREVLIQAANEVDRLKRGILLARVRQNMADLQNLETRVSNLVREGDEKKDLLEKSKVALQRLGSEDMREEEGRLMKELEEVDMARKEVLESEARLRKGVEIVRMNLREEESELRRAANEERRLRNEIQIAKQERQSIVENAAGEEKRLVRERDRRVECLKNEIYTEESALEVLGEELEELAGKLEELEGSSQANSIKMELEEMQVSREQLEEELSHLQRKNPVDPVVKWGAHGRLAAEVLRNARHFSQIPLGPLGMIVKAKNPESQVPVNTIVMNVGFQFITANEVDRRKLLDLAVRVGVTRHTFRIMVHDYNDTLYRIPSVPDNCVMNALEIDTSFFSQQLPVDVIRSTVMNTLVDSLAIEKSIIVDNVADLQRSNISQNIKNIVDFRGNSAKMLHTGSLEFSMISGRHEAPKIDVLEEDLSEKRQKVEESLNGLRMDIQSLEGELARVTQQEEACKQEKKLKERSILKLQHDIVRLKEDLEEAKGMNVDTGSGDRINELDKKIAEFEETLNLERERQNRLREKVEDTKRACEESDKRYQEVKAQVKVSENAKNEVKQALHKLRNDAGDRQRRIDEAKKIVLKTENRIKQINDELVSKQKSMEVLRVKIDELSKDSLGRHFPEERRRALKDRRYYETQEQELEKKLQEALSRLPPDIQELHVVISKLRAQIQQTRSNRESLKERLALLKKGQISRVNKFRTILNRLKTKTSANFDMNLRVRHHSGYLDFQDGKDEEGSLIIHVELDAKAKAVQGEKSSKRSQLKNLSGGEGSYATVAFLLALWESVETPFRVADEFDVFMDAAYRAKCLRMIMSSCCREKTKQFIFISPQDPKFIHQVRREHLKEKGFEDVSDDFMIFEMPQPRPRK